MNHLYLNKNLDQNPRQLVARFSASWRFAFVLVLATIPNVVLAQAPIVVQLQWKHQFEFAGFYAAIQQGFYAKRGLNVVLHEYQEGMNVADEVLSGRAQYGTFNSGIIQARMEGKPLVLLANYFKQMPMIILARPGINKLGDLRGKRLMVAEKDLNSPLYKLAFEKDGLKIGENIYIVPHNFNAEPFINGEVDAMSAFITNEPFDLQQRSVPFSIIDLSEYMRSLGDVYLFTTEQQTKLNPQQTQDFIVATNEGWQYALANRDQIVDLILTHYSQRKSRQALLYEAEKTYALVMPLPVPVGSLFKELIDDVAKLIMRQEGLADHNYMEGFIFAQSSVTQSTLYVSAADRKYLDDTVFRRASALDRTPLHFKDSNGEDIGITEDYWGLIRLKLGLKEVIGDVLLSADAPGAVKAGNSDLYPSTTATEERMAYAVFSDSYERYPIAIATRKNTGLIYNTAALEGHVVAVAKNSSPYYLLKERYPNIQFLQVRDTKTALDQVIAENAYAVVDILPVLQYHIQMFATNDLKLAGVTDVDMPLQVMISKKHTRLLPLINRAIAAITPQERLAIHKKWLLRPVIQGANYTLLWQFLALALIVIVVVLYWNRQMATEIAQRKIVEARLRTLSQAVEQTDSIIVITDWQATIEFANPAFFRSTGYTQQEVVGKNARILKSGKHDSTFYHVMWSTIIEGNVWRGELYNKRKDGSLYWESATISPVKDDKGRITHYVAVKEDIDERKVIEQALQTSREQYQRLLDDIGPAFVVYSRRDDGILEYVSKGMENIFGIAPEAAIGRNFADIVPWRPGTIEQAFKNMQYMFETGNSTASWEVQFGRTDDSLGTVLITAHPVKGQDGNYHKIEGIIEDITERKRAEEYMRASEQKLRSFYELSPLGIALTDMQGDMQGRYLEFNDAFMKICGYQAEELKNLDYWTLTPREYEAQEAAQLLLVSQTGRYGPYEKEYQRKDGTRIPLRLNGVLVTGQDGHGYIWSLVEDITVQKQHELALHQAKEDAETANRAKSAFLANMSHELRTPLNAVLGYAQILQQDPSLNPTQKQGVATIKRSGDYLLTLINDVLDLAKVEAGYLELFPHLFDLKRFFIELSDLFRIRAAEKGLVLHYLPNDRLPTEINADEKRLRQICMNLLSNAIKFTEQGEVRLEVDYLERSLTIDVTDTGIGIPPSMREQIFKPFVQTGEDRYKQQGTGLGLAISLNLVKQMGGCIGLESKEGQGSCFSVQIPVPVTNLTPSIQPATDPTPVIGFQRTDGSIEPFQALVVDDITENRAVIHGLLEPLGFSITEVADGVEAVNITTTRTFDVIFMDLVMPNMDGLTATYHILSRPCGVNRLIIALTARAFAEDRKASFTIGCRDYLVKPVKQQDLLKTLHTHLPLKWVHAPPATNSAKEATKDTILSDSQREILVGMVRHGAMHDIIRYLEKIIEAPDCPSQAHFLLKLAKEFKLADMRRLLESEPKSLSDMATTDISLPNNLAPEWLADLEQAVLLSKRRQALELLSKIESQHAHITSILTTWLEAYDYSRILEWIKRVKRPA